MSVSDRLLLRKRAIIETVNDELKNIAQVEHSRHRCFDNFIVNLLGAIAAYCLFPKSRASMYKGPLTHSLHCSDFVELTLTYNLNITRSEDKGKGQIEREKSDCNNSLTYSDAYYHNIRRSSFLKLLSLLSLFTVS